MSLRVTLFISCIISFLLNTERCFSDNPSKLTNHANLYYWYATESQHKLSLYDSAKVYAKKSNYFLNTMDSLNPEYEKLLMKNNSIINHYDHTNSINSDNLNGRYPYFPIIMGENNHHVLIDDANELCLEEALISLGSQLKGSKDIFSQPYFSVIQTNYDDPEIYEVIRQVVTSESCHYIINSHEMIEVLNQFKTNFNTNDLNLLSNHFDTKKIGIIDINFIDSINKIYYNSASFKEFNTNSNVLNQIAYVESFKEDKIQNKKTIINALIMLVSFLLAFLVLAKIKSALFVLNYFSFSIIISFIIIYLLILTLRLLPVQGISFYLESQSLLWRFSAAFIFSIIPILITYIGIMKASFLKEKVNKPISLTAICSGVYFTSCFYFLLFHIYDNGLIIENFVQNFALAGFLIVPAYSIGHSSSKLIINNEKNNLFFITINLLSVTSLFYFLILSPKIETLILPISIIIIVSLISHYSNSILETIDEIFKSKKIIESQNNNAFKFVMPNNFIQKTNEDTIFSDNTLNVNMIYGENGSGKTKVVNEISNIIGSSNFFYGDCDKETSVINYEPFVEAFSGVIGSGTFDDQASQANILSEKLNDSGLLDLVPGGQIVGAVTSSKTGEVRDHKFIIREITEFLQKNKDATIIAIEDIDNIDPNSLILLKDLIYEIGVNYNKYGKISFILTSSDSSSDENNLSFISELATNKIINENIIYSDLSSQYVDFKFDFINNLRLDYDSEIKILKFLNENEVDSPLHITEIVKQLDTLNYFDESKKRLSPNCDFNKISISKIISGIYTDTIESFDNEMYNILECASYIGKTFEANVIVSILAKERLDILNRLREAEKKGLIIDKNDQDDIYEFVSRSFMKEIRHYSINQNQKYNNEENSNVKVSQIVKEYNERIINYFYSLKDFNLQTIDLNLLISLANRSFENNFYRKTTNDRCIELNKAAAERSQKLGNFEDALKMYSNLYEISNKFQYLDLKLEVLLIMIKDYIEIGQIQKALELESELNNSASKEDLEIDRKILKSNLLLLSLRENEAYGLLNSLEISNLNPKQKINYNLLLAQILDAREKDDDAFNIYNKLLIENNLSEAQTCLVFNKLTDLNIQHNKIKEAEKSAEKGLAIANNMNNEDLTSNFIFHLLKISFRNGNISSYKLFNKKAIEFSEKNSLNLQNQFSLFVAQVAKYINNESEFNEIKISAERLLKMANYNRDYGIENNILLSYTIVKLLNSNDKNTLIELKEFLLKNKIDDLRLKITLHMMHDDLAILHKNKSEMFINNINEDIIREIPTLAPKYYYLRGIMNGKSINEMSSKYYEEISKIKECIFYEEFPFSIKLSKFDGKENICSKIFMSKRIQTFINE
tara:strand:+ start:1137 stop:5216 length:4080 start_codon:yes stop_codon:yes gene_type:complete